jgi:hypothetical protein
MKNLFLILTIVSLLFTASCGSNLEKVVSPYSSKLVNAEQESVDGVTELTSNPFDSPYWPQDCPKTYAVYYTNPDFLQLCGTMYLENLPDETVFADPVIIYYTHRFSLDLQDSDSAATFEETPKPGPSGDAETKCEDPVITKSDSKVKFKCNSGQLEHTIGLDDLRIKLRFEVIPSPTGGNALGGSVTLIFTVDFCKILPNKNISLDGITVNPAGCGSSGGQSTGSGQSSFGGWPSSDFCDNVCWANECQTCR